MKTETIQNLLAFIASECKAIDREARFDDMLDECYSFEKVGGIFAYMCPSRVLKKVDPIAYRCGVNDFIDGEKTVEVDGETYDADEVETAREKFVEELESERDDLEEELADLESEEDEDQRDEVSRLQSAIVEKNEAIEAAKKEVF